MRSETRHLSQRKTISTVSERKERVSNTTVDSQNLRLSDFSEDGRQVESFCQVGKTFEYKQFFQQRVQQKEITLALHMKAINWLVTFCWTRNFSQEVLWYSVGYFYSYSYSRVIKKDRLTLTLISAINLAIKLFEPDRVMRFETMKGLLNNVWSTQDFRNLQAELLEIFDFDLYFTTVLADFMQLECSEESRAKILFIAYEPAINDIILEDIIFVATAPETHHQLKTQIHKLFKTPKFMDVIKQKYASKFNIDHFLQKLLNQK